MIIIFQSEYAQNLVVFVNRFAKVTSFLLVVPVAIRIAVLSLDSRWVDISSVLSPASAFITDN
jgi:hypothetical protein